MTIDTHVTEFERLPVVEYSPEQGVPTGGAHAVRLGLDWDMHEQGKRFIDLFSSFVADPAAADVQALLIGDWGGVGEGNDSGPVVEALVSARDRLASLRALFLGEVTADESEISWIMQSDVSPLWEAYPSLEALYVRGGNGLRLGRPRHERLRKLVIETGGLPAAVVQDVTAADLPRLEHLELWLGDENYGNDVRAEDLRRLLEAEPCRQLTYLGLRDDCRADETAKLLSQIQLPTTLQVLDISLGTLSDEGARALASSGWLKQLRKLDIHYHYVSPEVVSKLRTLVTELDAADVQKPEEWDGTEQRYVAVSE